MTAGGRRHACNQAELVAALAIGAVPASGIAAVHAHINVCLACREAYEAHQAVTATFAAWPGDELPAPRSLWKRLMARLAHEPGIKAAIAGPAADEPDWEQVAPGIACKLLAEDTARDRISMLVRLAPGADYPPHEHADVEELHLLDGELFIDDRRLVPGDYNRAEPGTADRRVWSETGCTCVLVTSLRDRLA